MSKIPRWDLLSLWMLCQELRYYGECRELIDMFYCSIFHSGVQAAYWGMLDEGRITQTAAILLMQSVDEAIDMVASHETLLDWKGLETHVQFPSYFKYLHMRFLPQKLVTIFTVERLELACYICAAFLRAHRIARRQLREFIGKRISLQPVYALFNS